MRRHLWITLAAGGVTALALSSVQSQSLGRPAQARAEPDTSRPGASWEGPMLLYGYRENLVRGEAWGPSGKPAPLVPGEMANVVLDFLAYLESFDPSGGRRSVLVGGRASPQVVIPVLVDPGFKIAVVSPRAVGPREDLGLDVGNVPVSVNTYE